MFAPGYAGVVVPDVGFVVPPEEFGLVLVVPQYFFISADLSIIGDIILCKLKIRLVTIPGHDKHSLGPEHVLHEAWQCKHLPLALFK